jgi:putative ABC transport system permease protein
MRGTLRRLRAFAGSLGLLALLAFAAALLLTATPHLANRYTDQGLRDWVGSLSYRVRDVSYLLTEQVNGDSAQREVRPSQAGAALSDLRVRLPAPIRDQLGGAWYSTQIGPGGLTATGIDLDPTRPAPQLGLREQSEAKEGVRVVAGTWPSTQQVVEAPIPVAVSVKVAEAFHLRVGSRLRLTGVDPLPRSTVDIDVVGVFEVIDQADPRWAEQEEVYRPFTPVGEDPPVPWRGIMLTDTRGIGAAAAKFGRVDYVWRFRVADEALNMATVPALTKAVFDARTQTVVARATSRTELDSAMTRYANEVAATRAVLAVVQAGIVATLFGLVLLAAAASVQRRRTELALLRARGASLIRLGLRVLLESGLAVAVAVVAGFLIGRQVPGRPGSTDWILLVFAAAAMLAAPVLAVLAHRRFAPGPPRADLSRPRITARRITAEVTLVGLAAAGAYLVRRRGLALGTEVDVYLALVPVLLAAAAALVTLRAFPYPLRLFAAVAARARGAVPFLGLARAGRSAPASAGPLAVLVVAISVGVFSASVATTVSAGRDRVADLAVPGDAFVHGGLFTKDTIDRLAAVPGVTAVATTTVAYNADLTSGIRIEDRRLGNAAVVVVDAPALARVLAASGVPQRVPDVLTGAVRGSGPVPALVSSGLAPVLSGSGAISVQGQPYAFTVAAVADTFPGLPIDTERFVVLPLQALTEPSGKSVVPTGFVVAGPGADPAALAATGDEGQRAWLASVIGNATGELANPSTVERHADARGALDRSGVDRLLSYTFTVGAVGSVALALLAVGFAVVTGARARGQALSRLRTLGLSTGQGRRLLAYEIFPLVALGAVIGAAVGIGLPPLIGPALGLSTFTGGAPVVSTLDPRLGLAAIGLVAGALLLAVLLEAMVNKRTHLGEVLRVGGES